jgi:hypothetical protein
LSYREKNTYIGEFVEILQEEYGPEPDDIGIKTVYVLKLIDGKFKRWENCTLIRVPDCDTLENLIADISLSVLVS